MSHVHHAYPKCKYHAKMSPIIVLNKDEDKALGAEWFESPVDCASPSEGGASIEEIESDEAMEPELEADSVEVVAPAKKGSRKKKAV